MWEGEQLSAEAGHFELTQYLSPGFDELRVLRLQIDKGSDTKVVLPEFKFLAVFIVLSGNAKVTLKKGEANLEYDATKFSTWYASPQSQASIQILRNNAQQELNEDLIVFVVNPMP